LSQSTEKVTVHRMVRINYAIRAGAFAWSFIVTGLYGLERGFGAVFWGLLVLQFLVYPHLAYLRALKAADPKRAELSNLYLDAGLLGAWIAGFGFPTWLAYAVLHSTALNAIVLRGLRGVVTSVAVFCGGCVLWLAAAGFQGVGFQYWPATSTPITLLCFFGSLLYTCAIGYVEFVQNGRLVAAREALRLSETRYRLITENAADLVALVDEEGRWLYGSPSCARILGEHAVLPGGDAFARAHPGDADQARCAVRRVSMTGTSRELLLRLVDRDGRIRQFKTRVQPVEPDATAPGAPHQRLLLVSQDVTGLKESEERLLVQAHALEGMTEAILITSADGTVLTVNHAFTQLTGFTRDDVLGRPEKEIRNGLQPAEFYDEVFLTVMRKGFWTGTAWGKRKNGSVYREWRSVRAVKDANGTVSHYVMVFFEVEAPRNEKDFRSLGVET
jgi:PAS domain S-box-containing protein